MDVEAYQGSEAGFSELGGSHWISIAAANVLPKMALHQAIRLLKSYQLDTVRCHLDVVDDPGNGSVTMVSERRSLSRLSTSTRLFALRFAYFHSCPCFLPPQVLALVERCST